MLRDNLLAVESAAVVFLGAGLTEVAFRAWASHRVIGPWAMALLGLGLIEFLALAGLVVWRHDHRGLHDLVAKTHHRLLA